MGGAYPRFLTPPAGSFFLLGIRGVGKSTWARKTFPEAHVVDLLDERRFHALAAAPGTFADEIRALPARRVVVVDEVQRLPSLLNEVHRAMEDTRRRFVMLGSSARRLKTASTNLLAGRAALRTMLPLQPDELGRDFDLERVLAFGSIPVVWQAADPRAALDAYVQLYVREEIRAEALVRNLPAFLRFLPVAALFHGQVVNISGLARDAATSRTTIEGYVEILEETLLATRLPAFESRLRARERKHPKLYWVDPGLVRAAKRQLGELTAEERGPLFEGLVLGVLEAHNATGELFDEIAYWSPAQSAATEVDFVLRRGREHLALEVKHQTRTGPELLTGLRAIAGLPKLVRRIAVYRGRQALKTEDGIEVWPFAQFAEAVAGGSLWP
ncbi:MAG: ATP-binding protein [Vicinamibacterales bacterium]